MRWAGWSARATPTCSRSTPLRRTAGAGDLTRRSGEGAPAEESCRGTAVVGPSIAGASAAPDTGRTSTDGSAHDGRGTTRYPRAGARAAQLSDVSAHLLRRGLPDQRLDASRGPGDR